jgi:hypothetical protein
MGADGADGADDADDADGESSVLECDVECNSGYNGLRQQALAAVACDGRRAGSTGDASATERRRRHREKGCVGRRFFVMPNS